MTVYIFVKGGLVQEVIGAEDYRIVDQDDLTDFSCPYCKGRLYDDDQAWLLCPDCGINWGADPSPREIVQTIEDNLYPDN
jgi:hypothetical protein